MRVRGRKGEEDLSGQLQFSPMIPPQPPYFWDQLTWIPIWPWISCGAVCAELYSAEMHNRCNLPHHSNPQRCQVAGRQRAGISMEHDVL